MSDLQQIIADAMRAGEKELQKTAQFAREEPDVFDTVDTTVDYTEVDEMCKTAEVLAGELLKSVSGPVKMTQGEVPVAASAPVANGGEGGDVQPKATLLSNTERRALVNALQSKKPDSATQAPPIVPPKPRPEENTPGNKQTALQTNEPDMKSAYPQPILKESGVGQDLKAGGNKEKKAACSKAHSRSGKKKVAEMLRNQIKQAQVKLAEDAINPAQIGAPRTEPGIAATPSILTTAEDQKSAVWKQEADKINSNEKAIAFTKRDAKEQPKQNLQEVYQEPAQNKITDSTLQQNFAHSEEAGVKIAMVKAAAAKALLNKIAEEGCTCGGAGTCSNCVIKARVGR